MVTTDNNNTKILMKLSCKINDTIFLMLDLFPLFERKNADIKTKPLIPILLNASTIPTNK